VVGRDGASQKRQLILLISVGWVPPDWRPSGACLDRGTRVSFSLFTLSRVAPHRGCASSDSHGKPAVLWVRGRSVCGTDGVTGTCWAIAHIKPTSSRARATTTWLACFPRAIRRRTRWHSRTGAFQLLSRMAVGWGASRCGICRLTLAGLREDQAPSTKARRAWVFPAVVMVPCRRRSPLEDSEGISPKHVISGLG
jgi:hypothetical protein